jgi:hypothetical protein
MGYNQSWILTDCYATGSVVGGDHVGGLMGTNYSSPITTCHANGSVTGTNYVGGLMGSNSTMLTGCYATGSVTGTGASGYLGGLVGANGGILISCYATSSVSGGFDIGGLVGYDSGGKPSSCYATGSVSGTDNVGGLVGELNSSTLTDCYASGLVTGTSYVGGLAGYNNSGTFTACFWDINTSRTSDGVANVNPDPAGVTGKTTAQMMTLSTFTSAGWDFSATDGDPADWMMLRPGQDYPRLAWQTIIAGDIAGLYGVNFFDFTYFAQRWRTTGCNPSNNFCGGADLNASGTVDLYDLDIFADNWLKGI